MMFDPGATEVVKTVRLYPESGGLLSRAVDQGVLRAVLWLIRQYPFAAGALVLLGAQLILYYVLGMLGLRRLPFEVSVLFVWISLYFVLVSGIPAATARFRMPVMPLLCISAGHAIARWRQKGHQEPLDVFEVEGAQAPQSAS